MFIYDRPEDAIQSAFLRSGFHAILLRPFIRGSITKDRLDEHNYSFAGGRNLDS